MGETDQPAGYVAVRGFHAGRVRVEANDQVPELPKRMIRALERRGAIQPIVEDGEDR